MPFELRAKKTGSLQDGSLYGATHKAVQQDSKNTQHQDRHTELWSVSEEEKERLGSRTFFL